MDKLNRGSFGKRRKVENNKDVVRRGIPRDKYWNILNKEDSDNGICCYKKLKNMETKLIFIHAPHVKRYYRKMSTFSKLPFLEISSTENHDLIFDNSSAGLVETVPFSVVPCSYTDRLLKPFIFQDFINRPLWLKMQDELSNKVSEKFPKCKRKKTKKHPINYMYIQKEHISAINALAVVYFWPGIDISSSLWYPEFSCVALYKKLVIGFGIMTPGLYLNEGYINFLFVRPHWQSSGIASFILYHLAQTCISWNVTLHCSLSNNAVLLYNKYTFKVHKMIRYFYDERLPLNSNKSGHAFYTQLQKYLVD